MPSLWTEPNKPASEEFDSFLALYRAFLEDKTSDPVRLKFKINQIWTSYPPEKKKEYTARLKEAGVLSSRTLAGLAEFGGHITDFL
jgi:hypothetical protein